MADLKQLSIQLEQKCKEPCQDTVEIQPTTGTGKINNDPLTIPISQVVSQSCSTVVLVECLVRDQSISSVNTELYSCCVGFVRV